MSKHPDSLHTKTKLTTQLDRQQDIRLDPQTEGMEIK